MKKSLKSQLSIYLLRVVIPYLFFSLFFPSLLYAKPFTHQETYGKWTKKIASDGSKEPLYVTFTREFSLPDEQGVVNDKATITVMEPPSGHASYDEFSQFMSPDNIQQPKNFRLTAEPVISSTLYIGGFQAKVISGTGSVVSLDGSVQNLKLLGKGYYLSLPNRIIEILVQVQTIRGDLEKLEAEIDAFVSSFRFGEAEDLLIVRAIKGIPFQWVNPNQPTNLPPQRHTTPWIWILALCLSIILLFLVWYNQWRQKRAIKKVHWKKKNKK